MKENLAFTARCIADAQKHGLDLKRQAATDYLMRHGRLTYDFTHKLWLVDHPGEGRQVAAWMIDAAEPLTDEERAAVAISQFAKGLSA